MEIAYNLAINELKNKKMVLEKEVCNLLIERDKIYNEIADQRIGKTIVEREKNKIEENKQTITESLFSLQQAVNKQREDFVYITEKERKQLDTLERTIKEKQDLETQFLIKKEWLEGLTQKIHTKTNDLNDLKIELDIIYQNKIKELETIEKAKQNILEREETIKEKEEYLNKQQMALDEKELNLKIKEERLKDFKISLTN